MYMYRQRITEIRQSCIAGLPRSAKDVVHTGAHGFVRVRPGNHMYDVCVRDTVHEAHKALDLECSVSAKEPRVCEMFTAQIAWAAEVCLWLHRPTPPGTEWNLAFWKEAVQDQNC